MAFTYAPASPTDLTRVRWHIGDIVEASAIFTDADIEFAISEGGSYQQAVIGCLKTIIAKISAEPDFQADWLKADLGRSLAGYQWLLVEKRHEFDITALTATAKPVYRSDSLQKSAPDW